MNDRAVSVLDNYDLNVIRTQKGRNAILFETGQGWMILKEYRGPKTRLETMDKLLTGISENGFWRAERLIRNKEGNLFCTDYEQIPYIVKTWPGGRECSLRDGQECRDAVSTLAALHKAMSLPKLAEECGMKSQGLLYEYEKRNRELKRVRRFLREKSQKTIFEINLLQNYDYFLEDALAVTEQVRSYGTLLESVGISESSCFCHGDFSHHNLLGNHNAFSVINFEKYAADHQMRDLYLFLRKLLEKSNWSVPMARGLLDVYDRERKLSVQDTLQLYYRFAYPEKFWKIVNFYYNNGKSWIPGRNMEKFEKLLYQNADKKAFLEQTFSL